MITLNLIKLKHFFNQLKHPLRHDPFGLIIDTTILCNNNCSFCWRSNKSEYLKEINAKYKNCHTMDFEVYKKIIDESVKYKTLKWLSLSGPMGEPMLNNKFEEFIEYAFNKKHFERISINTNGLAIDKRDIARLLNSIHEFSISVDSINIDTYEKIHGNRNLPKVIDNIKKLVEYKKNNKVIADIYVRFTENEYNRGEFVEFRKFFEVLGIDYINYTQEHSFAGVNRELINEDHMRNHCIMPYNVVNFNFLGEMTTCCINWELNPIFGNIKNKTLKDMWNSIEKHQWNDIRRFDTVPCVNCGGLGYESQHSKIIKINKSYDLNSGERQVATTIDEIRKDHVNRYNLASKLIQKYLNSDVLNGLDIFCGNGYGSYLLSKKLSKATILSIDGSDEAISLANRYYKTENIKFEQKLFPFEIKEKEYDFVISLESIEHIKDDILFLEKISKSLKKGGILIISTPNNEKFIQEKNYNQYHYKHYLNNEFFDLLKKFDLELLNFYGQDVYEFNNNKEIVRVLSDEEMGVVEGYNGQFSIFVARKNY